MSTLSFGDQLALEAALEAAFEPLVSRTSTTSAARVRAAVRWGIALADPPPPSRRALAARLTETFAAIAAAALLWANVSAVEVRDVRPPSVIDDYFRTRAPLDDTAYLRWLRVTLQAPAGLDAGSEHLILLDRR